MGDWGVTREASEECHLLYQGRTATTLGRYSYGRPARGRGACCRCGAARLRAGHGAPSRARGDVVLRRCCVAERERVSADDARGDGAEVVGEEGAGVEARLVP